MTSNTISLDIDKAAFNVPEVPFRSQFIGILRAGGRNAAGKGTRYEFSESLRARGFRYAADYWIKGPKPPYLIQLMMSNEGK